MSTALRIAAVTQVLVNLLNQGLADNDVSGPIGGTYNVTSWPPDKIETAMDKENSQLNVFMYQPTYNLGWQNAAQPTFNTKGERVANPPLALDLHYLLTAYGSGEMHTDMLLGFGMQVFHEKTVLDKKTIRRFMDEATGGGSSLKLLSDSELVNQLEQVTLTPEVLSTEEISKLWSAFGAKYRPTAAYKVTVVLIESSKPVKVGLPVKERNIYVNPFREPVVEEVGSQAAVNGTVLKNKKILSGQRLVLLGKQLMHESAQVFIDSIKIDGIAGNLRLSESQISVALPPDIRAGSHQVQVVHPNYMGSPPEPHVGVVSKPMSFVLSPRVLSNLVTNKVVSADDLISAEIDLNIIPALNPGQEAVLLLNGTSDSPSTPAYSFPLPAAALQSPPEPTEDVKFRISGAVPGNYLLRIRVDGAESPLETNAGGQYTSPTIAL